jgi:sugar/nucleoside kinase (ribokinase family)
MSTSRSGILAAGNFIVDHVKIIDSYPQQDMLASILSQSQSNGGGPYNVLKDLAAMKAGFPLEACGLVGEDPNGQWIHDDCLAHGIDVTQLHSTKDRATSYTDAMTVQSTGRRTFFHQRGANALFDGEHCSFEKTKARLFHLGYLMLLDRMDSFTDGRTHASLLLERARAAGLETIVDIVSAEHPQFREIALSAIPFTDHLVINEVEAGNIVGQKLQENDISGIATAAETLLALGVARSVVIHFTSGCVAASPGQPPLSQGSLQLPDGFSQGATGAGDAFAAGYVYGVHENWPLAERLKLAVCCAAASLTHPTPSAGVMPVADCLALAERFPARMQ